MQGKIKKINNLLKNKKISALELTRAYIDYAQKNNPILNAYVNITHEHAISYAKETDSIIASGEKLPLLAGIPMSVKDCISTKGINTTCCSKMLLNYKPIYDAFAVELLQKNNAIMLGKTNMDEFAMGSTCENSYFGPCKNPYDISCVTGGSSGGAAASVSSDIAVFGLGSDTGGSVRQPAAFCGCVGLKPTYGAVSRYGLIAHASSFDQIGVLAQSVEDVAVVFDAINVYDTHDATSYSGKRTSVTDVLGKDVSGLKIGVITDLFKDVELQNLKCLQKALKTYEDIGAEIAEVNLSNSEYVLPVYYILACAEASSNLSRYDGVRYGYRTKEFNNTDEMISKTRSEAFGMEVKRRIMLGNYVLSSGYADKYYKKAQNMRNIITAELLKFFDNFDVLISPVTASTAFKTKEFSDPVSMYLTDKCTVIANLCGLPALSVPCCYTDKGMPLGIQIIGNRFCEDKILNVAYALENTIEKIKPQVGGDCLGI